VAGIVGRPNNISYLLCYLNNSNHVGQKNSTYQSDTI